MLLAIAGTSVFQVIHQRSYVNFVISKWLLAIPVVFGLLGAVFSGWLADAKLGNYRVMKYSFVLLFFLCLLSSAFTLVPGIEHYVYVVSVLSYWCESLYSSCNSMLCYLTTTRPGSDA